MQRSSHFKILASSLVCQAARGRKFSLECKQRLTHVALIFSSCLKPPLVVWWQPGGGGWLSVLSVGGACFNLSYENICTRLAATDVIELKSRPPKVVCVPGPWICFEADDCHGQKFGRRGAYNALGLNSFNFSCLGRRAKVKVWLALRVRVGLKRIFG